MKVTLSTSGDQAKDTLNKQSTPGFYDIFFMDNEIGAGPMGMEIIGSIKDFGYDFNSTFIAGISSQLQLNDVKCSELIVSARGLGYSYFLNKQPNNEDITHCNLINGMVDTLKNKYPELFLSISKPLDSMRLLEETNALIIATQEKEDKLEQSMKERQSDIDETTKIEEALGDSLREIQDEIYAMRFHHETTSDHALGNIARSINVPTIIDVAAATDPSINRAPVSDGCCGPFCFSFSKKKVHDSHEDKGNSTLNTSSLSSSRTESSRLKLPNI